MTAAARSVRWVVSALAVALLAGACSDDDAAQDTAAASSTSTTRAVTVAGYTLLSGDAWTLAEAHDPPAHDPVTAEDHPPADWYAEYDGTGRAQGVHVRLSGHSMPLADTVDALEDLGFTLGDPTAASVVTGRSRDFSGPVVVLVARGDRTVLLLSYDAELTLLQTLVPELLDVDSDGWLASGGTIA